MLPASLDAQISGLRKGLLEHGWAVASTEQPFEHEWWAAEFWEVESTWSPVGIRACLTFVVDPMARESVWAVCATSKRPHHRPVGVGDSMTLRHGWQRHLPAFLSAVGRLRHPGQSSPASEPGT